MNWKGLWTKNVDLEAGSMDWHCSEEWHRFVRGSENESPNPLLWEKEDNQRQEVLTLMLEIMNIMNNKSMKSKEFSLPI